MLAAPYFDATIATDSRVAASTPEVYNEAAEGFQMRRQLISLTGGHRYLFQIDFKELLGLEGIESNPVTTFEGARAHNRIGAHRLIAINVNVVASISTIPLLE